MPVRLREYWDSYRRGQGLAPSTREARRRQFQKYQELTGILHRAGVRLLAGTDAAEFLEHANLKEQPGDYPDAFTMLSNLCGDHEAVIQQLRKDADDCDEKYHDMGTNDFLIQLMQAHEKMAWMLRAFLEERR